MREGKGFRTFEAEEGIVMKGRLTNLLGVFDKSGEKKEKRYPKKEEGEGHSRLTSSTI